MPDSSSKETIQRWVRPEIQALQAYHVPPAEGFIKLDAMENPYPQPSAIQAQWQEGLPEVAINRYPDPSAKALSALLRQTMQVPEDKDILLGNGSDELIQMLALTVGGQNHSVLAPEPSFVMYKMLADITGLKYIGVPLRADDFGLDLEAMLAAITTHQPALIFLAYPNNPTGNVFERAAVEAILEAAEGLVIVDEAYCAFAEDSFMPDLARFDNLLVMRTVSKIGLAGLRLGLLAGDKAWMEEIGKTRLPYNINVLTQAVASANLQHYGALVQQTEQIKTDRADLYRGLQQLQGVQVWESQANFLLFRVDNARTVFEELKQAGILIKCLDGAHPLLAGCLRVTVGKAQENHAFLQALEDILP